MYEGRQTGQSSAFFYLDGILAQVKINKTRLPAKNAFISS